MKLKLVIFILALNASFIYTHGQIVEEHTWQPKINLKNGKLIEYSVMHKNTVTGNLSPNRDTEEHYSVRFKVLNKEARYYTLSAEYLYNDTTVNTLFDFIHKIIRPSFIVRLDTEQAKMDIENDEDVVQAIHQYILVQNKQINQSIYFENLKKALQSPDREELLYSGIFSDVYQIFKHLSFGEISIKDTVEYEKPVYSALINQEALGEAIFYIKNYNRGNDIWFTEEVVIPNYGDIFLEHSKRVVEGIQTEKPSQDTPKLDITYTSAYEAKIDLKSSLATMTSNKVVINSKDQNGTVNNVMTTTCTLLDIL